MGTVEVEGHRIYHTVPFPTGYGNLSPTTAIARILCIVFALFGIPLNLVVLNRIGQLMLSGVHRCARHLQEKFHWKVSNVAISMGAIN